MPFFQKDEEDKDSSVTKPRQLSQLFQKDKTLNSDIKRLVREVDMRMEEAIKILLLESIERNNVNPRNLGRNGIVDAITDFFARDAKKLNGIYIKLG